MRVSSTQVCSQDTASLSPPPASSQSAASVARPASHSEPSRSELVTSWVIGITVAVGVDDEDGRDVDQPAHGPPRDEEVAVPEELVGGDGVDVDDDAELGAEHRRLAQRRGELDLVGAGLAHRRLGAPVERERMHLDAACALGGREPDDELEAVDVVLGEREDESERATPGTRELEVRDRAGECPLTAADQVVLLRRAVDRDREHVHEPGERLPAPRGQEHAVGGDGGQHPELAGAREELRERAVEQRLAARDRELAVAEAGSGLEAVREELQRELPSDRRP